MSRPQKSFAADYIDVATRIVEFRDKYPDGSLQPANPADPFQVVTIGDKTFIVFCAAAYRTPDDPRPGIGTAWETFPGPTPYTRDSELQNAETSAWGRAIVAALAADTRKGVASADEVRNRTVPDAPPADQDQLDTIKALRDGLPEARQVKFDGWFARFGERRPSSVEADEAIDMLQRVHRQIAEEVAA